MELWGCLRAGKQAESEGEQAAYQAEGPMAEEGMGLDLGKMTEI